MDWLVAITPQLVALAALGGAITGIGVVWNRIVGPALGQTLLHSINEKIKIIDARGVREFANGVEPDDPKYVPMRTALDAHIAAEALRWEAHDAHASELRDSVVAIERKIRERFT